MLFRDGVLQIHDRFARASASVKPVSFSIAATWAS